MKQRLDDKQIAILNSKGVPFNKRIEPTIGGLIDILPEEIRKKMVYKSNKEWAERMGIDNEPCVIPIGYQLTIEHLDDGRWLVMYENENIACAHSIQNELIDGLYDLVIQCIDKEYLIPLKKKMKRTKRYGGFLVGDMVAVKSHPEWKGIITHQCNGYCRVSFFAKDIGWANDDTETVAWLYMPCDLTRQKAQERVITFSPSDLPVTPLDML